MDIEFLQNLAKVMAEQQMSQDDVLTLCDPEKLDQIIEAMLLKHKKEIEDEAIRRHEEQKGTLTATGIDALRDRGEYEQMRALSRLLEHAEAQSPRLVGGPASDRPA